MNCLDDNILAALSEGRLQGRELERTQEHLASCAACRDVVEALRPEAKEVRSLSETTLGGDLIAGTYRMLFPIGSGGMGSVYAAEHVRLGRRVAIKVLRSELRNEPVALERFRREAQVCGTLGSHHIVDVIDFNQLADGTPFLVMELLKGQDLAQRIERGGRLPPLLVAELLRQMCAALACAHREGIFHRDLKPSNVFLCETEGESVPLVKVLDFGISKILGPVASLTGSSEIIGTPNYMSPEMAMGRTDLVDHRADLFSLGAIAYQCLTGSPPFKGISIPAVLYQIVHSEPESLAAQCPDAPQKLIELVNELLEKDPLKRMRTAAELESELRQLFLGISPGSPLWNSMKLPEEALCSDPHLKTTEPARGQTSDAGEPKRRTRVALAVVVACAIAVFVVAGVFWRSRPQEAVPQKVAATATAYPDAGLKDLAVSPPAVDSATRPRPRTPSRDSARKLHLKRSRVPDTDPIL